MPWILIVQLGAFEATQARHVRADLALGPGVRLRSPALLYLFYHHKRRCIRILDFLVLALICEYLTNTKIEQLFIHFFALFLHFLKQVDGFLRVQIHYVFVDINAAVHALRILHEASHLLRDAELVSVVL